jgi:hypothetical protein
MRWKTRFPGADLARWANGRSAYVPETAIPSRIRRHLAAYLPAGRFGVWPAQRLCGLVVTGAPSRIRTCAHGSGGSWRSLCLPAGTWSAGVAGPRLVRSEVEQDGRPSSVSAGRWKPSVAREVGRGSLTVGCCAAGRGTLVLHPAMPGTIQIMSRHKSPGDESFETRVPTWLRLMFWAFAIFDFAVGFVVWAGLTYGHGPGFDLPGTIVMAVVILIVNVNAWLIMNRWRVRCDSNGVQVDRPYRRRRFIPAADIASVCLRPMPNPYSGGRLLAPAVVRKDGSEVRLDKAARKDPAAAETTLRAIQAALHLTPAQK